ncbi:Pyruvate-flavodoxin oxidoreductase [Smittium mucronatum]|uniref:Pyruvate-flavodoxin oxidoreductase n=1 Tax=Smittium mucronatum TaxID=133383 RepID=A0A1R0GV91_9FUNG|nr:Pyruvate-flavodoxin oxidoreductase [Smittium mucronatum]
MVSLPSRITGFDGIGLAARESNDVVIVEDKMVFMGTIGILEAPGGGPRVIRAETSSDLCFMIKDVIKMQKKDTRLAVLVSDKMIKKLPILLKEIYGSGSIKSGPYVSLSITIGIESNGVPNLDATGVYEFADLGFPIISPSTTQECFDYTQIASVAAVALRMPVINYFDADNLNFGTFYRANTSEPSKCITERYETYYKQAIKSKGGLDMTLREKMNLIMKASYRTSTVDYEGSPIAETVFVSIGDYDIFKYLDNTPTGCLSLHVFRPFPLDAVLKKIPKSVKRIVILDQVCDLNGASSSLYNNFKALVDEYSISENFDNVPYIVELESSYSIPIILSHPPYFWKFFSHIAKIHSACEIRLDKILGFPEKDDIEY